MSASIPETMKAVVIENGKAVVKQDIPIPELEEGFVLIKTVAVAGNPTDWKHIDFKIGPQGALLGCDAAGQIVKLGPNGTSLPPIKYRRVPSILTFCLLSSSLISFSVKTVN